MTDENQPTAHSPWPWPTEGAVLMHVSGDATAARRTANYLRARDCVEACVAFSNPTRAMRALAEAAAVALAVLPAGELQRETERALHELLAYRASSATPGPA